MPVRALRVTYVGELGWELYCPAEYGVGAVADAVGGGRPHGLVAGGYRAIDSMRLEKGYRVWGADITPDDTPYEAGLGFCVQARQGASSAAPRWTPRPRAACAAWSLEDPLLVALGNEPVRVGGEVVGRVTSGGYGYTVARSIAYAYLPAECAAAGTEVDVEVFGERVGAVVSSEPLFDPAGSRIRG